jgi:TRAP-type C4-dicarboxylate transport system permease small subunit
MRYIRLIEKYFEAFFMVVLMFLISIITGLQVFSRYVMNDAISWSEEVCRYMFVWMVFFGISYAIRQRRHIRILGLYTIVSEPIRKGLMILADLLFLFFVILMAVNGAELCATIFRLGQLTPSLEFSMAYIYASLPIGFTLAALRLVQGLYLRIRHIKLPYSHLCRSIDDLPEYRNSLRQDDREGAQ